MKKLALGMGLMLVLALIAAESAYAIKYVNGYSRSDGTYVSGHYKDTSGDGNEYNNANYLGLND